MTIYSGVYEGIDFGTVPVEVLQQPYTPDVAFLGCTFRGDGSAAALTIRGFPTYGRVLFRWGWATVTNCSFYSPKGAAMPDDLLAALKGEGR